MGSGKVTWGLRDWLFQFDTRIGYCRSTYGGYVEEVFDRDRSTAHDGASSTKICAGGKGLIKKHIHNLKIFRTTTDNGATSGERNGTKVLHVPAQREIVSIARNILREAYTTRCPNENVAFEREIDASSIGSEVEAKRQTGSISKTLVDTTRFFESRTTLSTACSNFWTVLKERHSKEPRTKSTFDEI